MDIQIKQVQENGQSHKKKNNSTICRKENSRASNMKPTQKGFRTFALCKGRQCSLHQLSVWGCSCKYTSVYNLIGQCHGRKKKRTRLQLWSVMTIFLSDFRIKSNEIKYVLLSIKYAHYVRFTHCRLLLPFDIRQRHETKSEIVGLLSSIIWNVERSCLYS